MRSVFRFVIPILVWAAPGLAQPMNMPMSHGAMSHGAMQHDPMTPAEMQLMNEASGTSMNPQSWKMPMLTSRLPS